MSGTKRITRSMTAKMERKSNEEQPLDTVVRPRKRQLSPSSDDSMFNKKRQIQPRIKKRPETRNIKGREWIRKVKDNQQPTITLSNEDVQNLRQFIDEFKIYKLESSRIARTLNENSDTIARLETQIKYLQNSTVQCRTPALQPTLKQQTTTAIDIKQVPDTHLVAKPVSASPTVSNLKPAEHLIIIEKTTRYKTIKINEDGDCQYASIAYLLKMDTLSVKRDIANHYRQMKVGSEEIKILQSKLGDRKNEKWLKEWQKEEKRYKRELKMNGEKPTKQHLHRMFQRHLCNGIENSGDYWGDEDTLEIAAKLYNITFRVYDNKFNLIHKTLNKTSTIGKLQFHQNHYMPIVSSVGNSRLSYI